MIEIKVKLFALLKEIFERDEIVLHFMDAVSCEDVLLFLGRSFSKLRPVLDHSMIAVNGQYASKNQQLLSGDELAILPPVSGG